MAFVWWGEQLDIRQYMAAVPEMDRFLTVELYTHTQDPHAAARKSHAFLRSLV